MKKYKKNIEGQHPPPKNETMGKENQTHEGSYLVRDKKIPL